MFLRADDMTEKPLTENGLEALLSLLGLPVLIGPGIVVWQIYTWLQTAKWRLVPVSDALIFFGIPQPRFDWLGLQKIADWVLDLPLSVTAFVVWMAIIVFGIAFVEEVRRKQDKKQYHR
jgi:hypothetical protein